MILRKYGKSYHSVTPNFDSRAMTEIGFQKSGEQTLEVPEFEAVYERLEGRELTAVAEGTVQDQVEKDMLEALRKMLWQISDFTLTMSSSKILNASPLYSMRGSRWP